MRSPQPRERTSTRFLHVGDFVIAVECNGIVECDGILVPTIPDREHLLWLSTLNEGTRKIEEAHLWAIIDSWTIANSITTQLGEHELPLLFSEDFEYVEHLDPNNNEGTVLSLVSSDVNAKFFPRWETTDKTNWAFKQNGCSQVFGLVRRNSDFEPEFRSPLNRILLKEIEVADFVLTFDVRSTNDTGNHRDCCVFFGYQNPNQFYYAHLGAKPDPASGQIMIVDKAARSPMTENEKTVGWDDNWHHVKVTRDSATGKIDVYFDDMQNPQMSATDNTFGKGRVGIGSFDDMNDFDNFRLWGQ